MRELGHFLDVVVGEDVDATVALERFENEGTDVTSSAGVNDGFRHGNKAIHILAMVDTILVVVDGRLRSQATCAQQNEQCARRGDMLLKKCSALQHLAPYRTCTW